MQLFQQTIEFLGVIIGDGKILLQPHISELNSVCLVGLQFRWFDLFVLVLGYSESELNSVCLVGFLSI